MSKLRLCHRCRERIPEERLDALPDTWLCIRCSQEIGSDYEVGFTRDQLGKAGSLKRITGGVTFKKRRRRIEPLEPTQEEDAEQANGQ